MRQLRTTLIIIVLISAAGPALGEVPEQVLSERQRGSEMLKKLAEKNYRELGFESPKEALEIQVGFPLREFMVRLDQLKEYRAESDPRNLLGSGNEYMFPVTVGKEVKSSFSAAKVGDKWVLVSFGSPNRTKLVMTVLNQSISEKRPVASFFLVKVPALYYHFLGFREDGKIFLIPLLDDKSLELSAGKPLPAEKVFEAMASLARKTPVLGKEKD